MIKAIMATAMLALLFFAAAQQSYAQYGTGPTTGKVTEETLAKCKEFGIGRAQCSESAVLLAERLQLQDKGGSGTAMLALGSDQTIAFIGILGAVFGGVSAAFFLRGRQKTPSA